MGDAPDPSLDITSWSFAPIDGDTGVESRVAVADLRDGASSPGGTGRLFTTTSRLTFNSGTASPGIVDVEVRVWQRPDEPVEATLYLSGEGNGLLGGREIDVVVEYDSAADCVTVELLWDDVWHLVETYAERTTLGALCGSGSLCRRSGSSWSSVPSSCPTSEEQVFRLGAPELLIILFFLVPIAYVVWAIVDAARIPGAQWRAAEQSQTLWIALMGGGLVLGCFFVGFVFALIYRFVIRPKVSAAAP